jgi:hypothetical protein
MRDLQSATSESNAAHAENAENIQKADGSPKIEEPVLCDLSDLRV